MVSPSLFLLCVKSSRRNIISCLLRDLLFVMLEPWDIPTSPTATFDSVVAKIYKKDVVSEM